MKRVVITGFGVLAPNGNGSDAFTKALRGMISGIRYHEKLKDLDPNVYLVKNALPDFFNISTLKHKPIGSKIKLLFFSNLSKEKGIFRLASIIRLIAESDLNCEVNIYGGILDKANAQIFNTLKIKYNFINYFGPITDEKEKYNIFSQNNFLLFYLDYYENDI